jgi:hypothetical protein
MPPTATTVPVEQDSSAARLEAAEQLPETLDPESLRKYFTLTETDLQGGEKFDLSPIVFSFRA